VIREHELERPECPCGGEHYACDHPEPLEIAVTGFERGVEAHAAA
jgi:hypothetical protein